MKVVISSKVYSNTIIYEDIIDIKYERDFILFIGENYTEVISNSSIKSFRIYHKE